MARKIAFKVTLEMPRGVSKDDMIEYIADAVKSWKGSFKPVTADEGDGYDLITDLDEETVVVTWPVRRK